MHGTLPADPQGTIFSVAQGCSENAETTAQLCSEIIDGWFGNLAKHLWPKKTAAALEYLTGAKERVCHYWVAGREPNASVLVTLLRSEEGKRVLDHVMRGSKAKWWVALRRDLALAALASQFKNDAQQLELQFE